MHHRNRLSIRFFMLALLLISSIHFLACLPDAIADDHGHKAKHSGWHGFSISGDGKDKGNEFTGETTAWIFAAANLPVLLNLLFKALIRRSSLSESVRDRLKRFNQAQKRYLMPFHYLLNPLAVIVALIHFSLSICRSSALPEWGLAAMAVMAVIGMMVKFKVTPKSIRKTVYQIHTNPLPVGFLVVILLIGHGMVD